MKLLKIPPGGGNLEVIPMEICLKKVHKRVLIEISAIEDFCNYSFGDTF